MYHKLARGYATAYIQSLQQHEDVIAWSKGSVARRALKAFHESSLSKKPGRVSKRMATVTSPVLPNVWLAEWQPGVKSLWALGQSSAPDAEIFEEADEKEALFEERSVFLASLVFLSGRTGTSANLIVASHVSHHALTRLLERELFAPSGLARGVLDILFLAQKMALARIDADMHQAGNQAFLVPYGPGALAMVTMRARAGPGCAVQPTLSIRTYLDADKISAADRRRMGDAESFRQACFGRDAIPGIAHWMEGNVRPWSAIPAAGSVSG